MIKLFPRKLFVFRHCFLLAAFCISFTGAFSQAGSNPVEISGKVTSANQEPMFGVSVLSVLSAGAGTSTDADGNYSLVAYANDTLVFTAVGYKELRIPVDGRTVIDVTISEAESVLDDVVIVAYGQQKRVSLTGAMSTVTTRELRQSPVANLSNALAGRLPGLVTFQPSGEPGNDLSRLFIRGTSTLNSTSPLVVVDGVLGRDFAQLDPNEVESLTILKDASATAVYGVRGANGVILVTTRRGKGGRPSISFTSEYGFQGAMTLPKYASSYDYARLYNEALQNDGVSDLPYSEEDLEYYRIGADPYLYPNTDWIGTFLKDRTPMYRANLNISGGGERVRYFVSGSALTQDGLYNFTDENEYNTSLKFNRYNFRSNIDINVTKDFEVGLDLAGRVENRKYPGGDTWLIFTILNRIPPTYPIRNADGSLAGDGLNPMNPLGMIANTGYRSLYGNHLQGTYRMSHKLDFITKGLSASAAFAFDAGFEYTFSRWKDYAVYQLAYGGTYNKFGNETALATGKAYAYSRTVNFEGGLNYGRSFGAHNLTGLLLYNQNRRVTYNAPFDLPYDYKGYVGRFTYNYDERYFAELNLGYNGSEQFPEEKRYGLFPSFSAGWVISNEAFYNDDAFVNFLKIRASYGQVGNDQMGARRYLYIPTYGNATGYYFGPNMTGYSGIAEGALANPAVTWERANKANLGIETNALNGRLSLTTDLFYEKRSNILATSGNIPYILGKSSGLPPVNMGVIENKGFEVELTYKNAASRELHWMVSGNFSFARNRVLNMDEEAREYAYQSRTGKRVGQRFGLVALGLYQSQEEIDNAPDVAWMPKSALIPGDIRYKDVNGDGIVDSRDEVAIGHNITIPEIMYGLSSRLNYKGADFSFLLQGAGNSSFFMDNFLFWEFRGGNGKIIEWHLDRWTPETAATATYPALHMGESVNNHRFSTYWMRPRDYLRLKNLELGYTINTKRIGINSVRIYANGMNLLTFSQVKLTDPENPSWGEALGTTTYPVQKVYNFGINVNF
ncbi:MAG: TonB-dependent receptor [Niabella sp.]